MNLADGLIKLEFSKERNMKIADVTTTKLLDLRTRQIILGQAFNKAVDICVARGREHNEIALMEETARLYSILEKLHGA